MNSDCIPCIEEILEEMEPKIHKSLYNTKLQNREDLQQELRLDIIKAMKKNTFSYTPGFWELAEKLQ